MIDNDFFDVLGFGSAHAVSGSELDLFVMHIKLILPDVVLGNSCDHFH